MEGGVTADDEVGARVKYSMAVCPCCNEIKIRLTNLDNDHFIEIGLDEQESLRLLEAVQECVMMQGGNGVKH